MIIMDSHCHLDDEKFNEDRKKILEKIKQNDMYVICSGYSLETSKKAVEIANQNENIFATVGISPNDVFENKEEMYLQLEEIEKIAKEQKKVIGIGEIGLDYYWKKNNKDIQKEFFIKQIEIANRLMLPIAIHSREAYKDIIEILKQNPVKQKGVFHCCEHNMELIREALEINFYISFAGPITFKNAKHANDIISMVPNDKFLIETDSPYLSPEPRRGKRNDPTNVIFVAKKIAETKKVSLEEIAKYSFENAKKLYKLG